mgnify:CR=1 FL=1
MEPIVAVALSYLSGSIPFAAIAGKLRGVDLRKHGSGNLGATNVFRVLGWKIGLLVFVADALKGALPDPTAPSAGAVDGPADAAAAAVRRALKLP